MSSSNSSPDPTDGTIYSVCKLCTNTNSEDQSANVVVCIGMSLQVIFYIVLSGLCVKEIWQKHKNKQRMFTKKCYVLYSMLTLSLVQIMWLTIAQPDILKMFDIYARQMLFCCVFFYFIHKYYKLSDSKKISQRPKLICVFAATILTQLGLMISSYVTSFPDTSESVCSDLSGIWIRMIGCLIGFLFVGVGFQFYKKFSIQKKNLISLFTIEKEQGIKNFLDQEDKIEDLLSLIIVYFATQVLVLCVLIYFELQITSEENIALQSTGFKCSLLPPSYLQSTGVGGMAGEHALKICLNTLVIFLPQYYLFNLFKYKQPRTEYSDEVKKSLIQNEEQPKGFGRYIMFNKNSRGAKGIGRRTNNHTALYQESSNHELSPAQSFISYSEG